MAEENKSLTDRASSREIKFTSTGAITFASMAEVVEVARLMAASDKAVPDHLRNNPGACLGVALQASEWQMSPYAVANKSYVVKDRIAYEAQMINAVILRRAPIKGRFKIVYSGEGPTRKCKVSVTLIDSEGGEEVEYESPPIAKIPVQNSPLWKGDPDQQLFYYSSRAMCRRHFPDVILGVYSPDELEEEPVPVVEIESKPVFIPKQPVQRMERIEREVVPLGAAQQFEDTARGSIPATTLPPQDLAAPPEGDASKNVEVPDAPPAGAVNPAQAPTADALEVLKSKMDADSLRVSDVTAWLFKNNLITSEKLALRSIPENTLIYAAEHWKEILASVGVK